MAVLRRWIERYGCHKRSTRLEERLCAPTNPKSACAESLCTQFAHVREAASRSSPPVRRKPKASERARTHQIAVKKLRCRDRHLHQANAYLPALPRQHNRVTRTRARSHYHRTPRAQLRNLLLENAFSETVCAIKPLLQLAPSHPIPKSRVLCRIKLRSPFTIAAPLCSASKRFYKLAKRCPFPPPHPQPKSSFPLSS